MRYVVWAGLIAVWLAVLAVFLYVSYVHWPWRSLSAPAELGGQACG